MDEVTNNISTEESFLEKAAKAMLNEPHPLYEIGTKVRMKQEVLDELDAEGTWAWHESLKGKILTVTMIEFGPAGWVDYYVRESPFVLAEKWLEQVKVDPGVEEVSNVETSV